MQPVPCSHLLSLSLSLLAHRALGTLLSLLRCSLVESGLGALVSGISGLMGGAVPPPPAPPQDGSRVVLPMAQSQVEQVEEL